MTHSFWRSLGHLPVFPLLHTPGDLNLATSRKSRPVGVISTSSLPLKVFLHTYLGLLSCGLEGSMSFLFKANTPIPFFLGPLSALQPHPISWSFSAY